MWVLAISQVRRRRCRQWVGLGASATATHLQGNPANEVDPYLDLGAAL